MSAAPAPESAQRSDRASQRLHALLDGLRTITRALPGAMHDRGQDSSAPHRRLPPGSTPPGPLDPIAYQQELTTTLAHLLRTGRRLLGLSDQYVQVSSRTGVRCPYCAQLTLAANLTAGTIWCRNPQCLDGAPPSWDLTDPHLPDVMRPAAAALLDSELHDPDLADHPYVQE